MYSDVKRFYQAAFLVVFFGLMGVLYLGSLQIKAQLPPPLPDVAMNPIQVDRLGTGVLSPNLGQIATETQQITWPENRWLVGWSPWIGYGRGTVLESHLILFHGTTQLFVRGPHKEGPSFMYDCASNCDFFPSGSARFVKAKEVVSIQFLVSNTGSNPPAVGGQANARIFTVKVSGN